VYLIDPFSLKISELSAQNYFRNPFRSICNVKQLTEWTIMDIDSISEQNIKHSFGPHSDRHILADVWIVKSSEIGVDNQIHTRSHLGHLLKPGDTVLAFDMASANINEPFYEKYANNNADKLPDAIIVKKHYGEKALRNRKRLWKLRHLDINASENSSDMRDLVDFMEDLEEDQTLRQNVNIFADKEKIENMMAVDTDELDEDAPKITLQEMLEDLNI